MKIRRASGVAPARDRRRWSRRRFRVGERAVARVVRRVGGPMVILELEGTRLLAWLEVTAKVGDELYVEVVSAWPTPRFRALTGGPAFWSLPVGRSDDSKLTTEV